MLTKRTVTIVMADDDPDDQLLTREALEEARLQNTIDFVDDGEQLLRYLRREGEYARLAGQPLPGVILLDLNMPRMDGRQALQHIKADARLRQIPVVVLTTSKAEEDMLRSYDLGASSFITKPVTFESMVEVVRTLGRYWFQIVYVPAEAAAD